MLIRHFFKFINSAQILKQSQICPPIDPNTFIISEISEEACKTSINLAKYSPGSRIPKDFPGCSGFRRLSTDPWAP